MPVPPPELVVMHVPPLYVKQPEVRLIPPVNELVAFPQIVVVEVVPTYIGPKLEKSVVEACWILNNDGIERTTEPVVGDEVIWLVVPVTELTAPLPEPQAPPVPETTPEVETSRHCVEPVIPERVKLFPTVAPLEKVRTVVVALEGKGYP